MIFLIVFILWVMAANNSIQLLLLAGALFIRVFYVDGKLPKYSIWIVLPWLSIGILNGVFFDGEWADKIEAGIFYFLKVSLSTILAFHMMARILNSPLRRYPVVREIWLIYKRSLVILPKKFEEMGFWARQRLRALDRQRKTKKKRIRYWIKSRARAGFEIGIGLLMELVEIDNGFKMALHARGGFPRSSDWIEATKSDNMKWWSTLIGDVLLIILMLVPLAFGAVRFIPDEVLSLLNRASEFLAIANPY